MHVSFSGSERPVVLAAAALAATLLGCGNSGSPHADGSGGAVSTGGVMATGGRASGGAPGSGGTTASGGTTTASGGTTTASGGTTTASGGTTTAATGGRTGGTTTATGGRATGGSPSATGGDTSATGGRTSGGSSGAGGATADAALDTAADAIRRDASPDLPGDRILPGDLPGDAPVPPPADGPPPGDGGITVPDGYKLVWSDEFNTDGTPDPKNWNYEKGFARNEELQWYQPDNATVKDGLLVIEARKERVANPNYQAGSSDWKTSRQYADYTSTSMTTSGLQSWQYGRFEMRARIPTSAGMWPAWWTLGVSGEWPSNGEIDIMEYYKGNVLANVACGTATRWTAKWDSSTKSLSSLGGATWAAAFHVWRMDWNDQKIDLYLDDALMNSVPLSSMLNADGTSPFKQKDYMLVNLALGGVNGGDPSGTTFPQRYEVDWIRVFQKL